MLYQLNYIHRVCWECKGTEKNGLCKLFDEFSFNGIEPGLGEDLIVLVRVPAVEELDGTGIARRAVGVDGDGVVVVGEHQVAFRQVLGPVPELPGGVVVDPDEEGVFPVFDGLFGETDLVFDRGGGLDEVAEAEVEEAAAEPGAVDADGVVGRRGQVLFLDEVRGGDGRDVLQPDVVVEVGGLLQDIREESAWRTPISREL